MSYSLGPESDRAAEFCSYCPKLCRFNCPVAEAEHRETTTPWGMMRLAHLLRTDAVAPDVELAEALYHCTGCRRCQTWCAHDNDVPQALWAARAELAAQGFQPDPVLAFIAAFDAQGSPEPQPTLPPHEGVFDPESRVVFMPDCKTRARDPELVVRAGALLAHLLGHRVRLAVPDGCCGFPLLAAGDPLGYEHQRDDLERALDDPELVITDCAGFAALYREGNSWGARRGVEVVHLIEVLIKHGPQRPPEAQIDVEGAMIHDSCLVGRQLGLLDETREAVRLLFSTPAAELHLSREQATCCGACDVYSAVAPEESARMAENLLGQVALEGGDAIICGAARCKHALRDASDSDVAIDLLEAACIAYGF